MITKAVIVEEYRFRKTFGGYDHLEGLQEMIDKELGEGVMYIYNKRGSTIMMMFIENLSMVKRVNTLSQVEKICELEYYEKGDAYYQPTFLDNLKRKFGDKLAVN